MALANTQDSYGSVTKVFHWLTAALILAIIPLGAIGNRLPINTESEIATAFTVFTWHKTLGVTVFFVALLRILWALSQVKPGSLHPDRKGETLAAETVHWLLYGSLVIAPLTGWIHHASVTGFAPIWWPFGQGLPFVPVDEGVAHTFELLHWIMTKVMIGALLLHIAGALKHVFVDKDATLRRMWFGQAQTPPVTAHRSPITAPIVAIAVFLVAGFGILATDSKPAAAELPTSESDWAVQNGTLAITVLQLGSEVSGTFEDWSADIYFDPESQSGEVTVTIAIGSLSLGSVTGQAMGPDFFDATQFPTATFSGPIENTGGATFVSDGTLTIKGIAIPVQFAFDLIETDGVWQMDGTAEVDRLDFDIGTGTDAASLDPKVVIDADLSATLSE
ncbi:Cytochrome b561 [Cognatiyoonia koreensis]|uniref:Cytochrome b561 n=1 Tax=Cognatiyoonia koreensis TaxID=364200 RepID=A0A1I0NRG2_9RHOB|nr:cytochrome b/b6 domain-containing protein [Cognatiyoonia koreensis]SEW04023.1 Cytochrome b561 [Cognatiyoonia koreensis]